MPAARPPTVTNTGAIIMQPIGSLGKIVYADILESLQVYLRGSSTADAEIPVIWNITPHGTFVGGFTPSAFFSRARQIVVDSGRVFSWQNTLVFEFGEAGSECLLLLAANAKADQVAPAILANLFSVGVQGEEQTSFSLPPSSLVSALLADSRVWEQVPAIKVYARRPVFDSQFNLCGPGWHPREGIKVHGPDVTPATLGPRPTANTPVRDRLPPYTRQLLAEFCWASDADLVNALALLLTGLLSNHFVQRPKPMGILDGNQVGVGKMLFCEAAGLVLDGVEPERTAIVRDEELAKALGAKLRESRSSIILLDNLKDQLNSSFIEANALSPILSVRILGHSKNISRPNTYLWLVTSNQTSGSSDLISRGIPVRLRFEGDATARTFHGDLVTYALQHRLDILGELAAMVLRWKDAGCPEIEAVWPTDRPLHRCRDWTRLIGAILATNGFVELLANAQEARAEMDEGMQALAALAEHIAGHRIQGYYDETQTGTGQGKLPGEWADIFQAAGVYQDKFTGKTPKSRHTIVGSFLSAMVGRSVAVSTEVGSTAILRRLKVRGAQKRYYFEIVGDAAAVGETAVSGDAPAAEVGHACPVTEPGSPTGTSVSCEPQGAHEQLTLIEQPPLGGNDLDWTG
jgi:hypothetical protein